MTASTIATPSVRTPGSIARRFVTLRMRSPAPRQAGRRAQPARSPGSPSRRPPRAATPPVRVVAIVARRLLPRHSAIPSTIATMAAAASAASIAARTRSSRDERCQPARRAAAMSPAARIGRRERRAGGSCKRSDEQRLDDQLLQLALTVRAERGAYPHLGCACVTSPSISAATLPQAMTRMTITAANVGPRLGRSFPTKNSRAGCRRRFVLSHAEAYENRSASASANARTGTCMLSIDAPSARRPTSV